jgi:hypothetical protein
MSSQPYADVEKAGDTAAMPNLRRSCRYYLNLINNVFGLTLLFLGLGFLLYGAMYPVPASPVPSFPQGLFLRPMVWKAVREQSDICIAKATILYEGGHGMYKNALLLHEAHNERFVYYMHVLRSKIVRGGLNKALWLQQLIIAELQKPVEEQMEWILYASNFAKTKWNRQLTIKKILRPLRDLVKRPDSAAHLPPSSHRRRDV